MTDFLLELRSEEIPARMQAGARADLERLFRAELSAAGVAVGDVTVWSTPRRLALIAHGLPQATEAVSVEEKGPPEGAPDQAIDGFCRKNNVTRDQLELRDVKGRATWFAVRNVPGRAVKDVLAEAIPAIVRAFPWPKSMRWGTASITTESTRWVRPLSGIVAIFGEELVACEAGGVASGYATKGHRFHCPGEITIGSAADYAEKLRACHVIVDHEERQDIIRSGAAKAAADAGLSLVEDEGLVIENAGLTEWPVPLLGRFDEAFLEVPPEVIQLTARVNQKYFVCTQKSSLSRSDGEGDRSPQASGGGEITPPSGADAPATSPSPRRDDREDRLANAFICTANVTADDGGAAIVDGNRKVLAARLSDARFFWEQDKKIPLAKQAEKLARITFHEKLGTVADKVERVAKLARWLVEEGIVTDANSVRVERSRDTATGLSTSLEANGGGVQALADQAELAARLCKADLVTEMVGEFPELQGLMGGYYARAEGLPDAVADAIRDHYKPVGQGDDVPTAPVTVAVSLADKLDTIASFFAIDERPTGSKDPFALRRAALGVLSLLANNGIRVRIRDFMATLARIAAVALRSRFEDSLEENDIYLELDLFCPDIFTYRLNFIDGEWDTRPRDFAVAILADLKATHLHFDNLNHGSMVATAIADFFADRLKVQQREAGVRHDLIDAVFALGGEDDLVRLLARVHALQAFVGTEDGTNLLAGYKRAANILKKEDWHGIEGEIAHTGEEDPLALVDDPDLAPVIAAKMEERHTKTLSYSPEPAEKALIDALADSGPRAAAAVEAEDFEGAMAALAALRAPIDRFFEEVTVNDADAVKRSSRLDLLAQFRAAVHKVADFSKVEG